MFSVGSIRFRGYIGFALGNVQWLTQNQNNVSGVERHVYPQTLVSVSWHYTNSTRRVGLEQRNLVIVSLIINLFSP